MGFWQRLNEKAAASSGFRKFSAILFIVALVIIALVVITFIVEAYNKQKVGESSNPAAQKASLELLDTIPVKGRAPKTGYSRDQFGRPWTDDVDGVEFGHNGCDTRNDILRRDLSDIVSEGTCVVDSGVLHDPYSGKDVPFDREEGTDVLVQIDHVVPLLDAWQKGAQLWDQAKRVQFANDPLNLLAVSGKENRKKNAGDVATWLPKNVDYRCDYVTRWVDVKAKYGLWMTDDEHDAAARVLTKCSSQLTSSSAVHPSSDGAPSTGSAPLPTEVLPPTEDHPN